jgi:sigma-B regulation protein RsbU (phosphoserine phosphatase)
MSGSAKSKPRLGMFLRGGDYTYQNEIVLGAHDECQEHGVDLYCFAGGLITTPDPRNLVYQLCGPEDLDGVILVTGTMASEDSPEIEALFRRFAGLPICTIGSPRPGVPSLGVDNTSGVRELTRHLIERHQCRRIAFIAGQNNESARRLQGYQEALAACGLTYDARLVQQGDFTPPSGARAVATLFEQCGGCDGIVAGNDWMALGALDALEARGLRVPEDVALTGFDDIEQARFVTPPLSTVRQSPRQLGSRAVRRVLGVAENQPEPMAVLLPTLTIIRQSCGCRGPKPNLELDVPSAGQSLLNALGSSRDAWIRALKGARPFLDQAVRAPTESSDVRIVDALLSDLQNGTEHQFVMAVEGVVRQSAQMCNAAAWHDTISRLRCEVVSSLSGSARAWLRAETVFEQAQLLISSLAEHAQAKRRLEKEGLMRGLEEMSAAVRNALDIDSLRVALAEHLPNLRISSLHVAVQQGEPHPDAESRMLLAYDDESQLNAQASDLSFRTGEVIPNALRPAWRHSVMVQPLFFKDQALGFCVIEIGSRDGSVFKTIPELISTALKATQLAQAIALEATRRHRAEQARMSRELEIAASIQTGILPVRPLVLGLQIATRMLPTSEVGGDYFDILPCQGGCWLGIGDVAGHGLHTGLVMLMIQSIVAATTLALPNATPTQAWAGLNSVLYDNVRRRLQRDEHATLTLLRYHSDGRLIFAGAHEEFLIYRAAQKACQIVETPGLWVGIVQTPAPGSVMDSECQLSPGDVLLLYTDGLTEARNKDQGLFGVERLSQSLLEVGERPVDEIREHILEQVRTWTTLQRDDLTLVVLRHEGEL